MTFKRLEELIIKNNIPKDVKLMSDSGWECCETEMNGVYYNQNDNCIIFTQTCDKYCEYEKLKNWKRLSNRFERKLEQRDKQYKKITTAML